MRLHSRIKTKALDIISETSSLNLPNALLIIPDGNGRWAKEMGKTISEGHKAGGKTMANILDDFMSVSIRVLGIWGFSEDNWKREKNEIDKIMEVIQNTVSENLEKLIKNNINFLVLGKRDRIQKEYPMLFQKLTEAIDKTSQNKGKTLALFLDYGERFLLEEFAKARKNDKKTPTYGLLSRINQGLPLFDMILRTSGEKRLSGFGALASLAEFVPVEKNLPELTDRDIIEALKEFSKRQRRFGGR